MEVLQSVETIHAAKQRIMAYNNNIHNPTPTYFRFTCYYCCMPSYMTLLHRCFLVILQICLCGRTYLEECTKFIGRVYVALSKYRKTLSSLMLTLFICLILYTHLPYSCRQIVANSYQSSIDLEATPSIICNTVVNFSTFQVYTTLQRNITFLQLKHGLGLVQRSIAITLHLITKENQ